jgi:asparagine synthase (glutamine-hydrolysing)
MCGIAGFVGASPLFDRDNLLRMLQTMRHRGPDADGTWIDPRGRCLLGHRRLSIIDTSAAGRQPMAGSDGRWVISFNGEIYNFLELRPELEALGIQFHGRTDTEVLVAAIAQWGSAALERLDGMFAFAAFDTQSGELLLARDPFGEKPLYYWALPSGGIAFASELSALELLPGFDSEVSIDAIAELLLFQYIGAPRTIYRSVQKLPPGHWLRIRPGSQPTLGRYFGFNAAEARDAMSLQALADETEELLVRSLRRRMIADVPLGAFLSGGVDSSTVCALVRHRLKLPLSTFSIGFRGDADSEHEAARQFANHLGTTHREQILDPAVGDFLLNIGAVLDEPNADSSCLPTYLLSQFARKHVTVALSGDGGDELFCGYDRYLLTLAEEASSAARSWDSGKAYYGGGRILISTEDHVAALLGAMPRGTLALLEKLRQDVRSGPGPLHARMRNSDVANYLPGAVLPKVDRMSMRHSLEVRTPFLNVGLARLAERMRLDHLYQPGRGKVVLREIARRYLPAALIERPKRGFGLPTSLWGKDQLIRVAEVLLLGPEGRLRAALGDAALDYFLAEQRSSGGYNAYRLWAVGVLESWCRHHPAKLPRVERDRTFFAVSKPIAEERATGAMAAWVQAMRSSRTGYLARLVVERLRFQRRTHGNFAAFLWLIRRIIFHSRKLLPAPRRKEDRIAARAELLRLIDSRTKSVNQDLSLPSLQHGDRVVVVSHDLAAGGAQRQWCYLARGLKDRGYEVLFVLIEDPVGPNGHYLEYIRQFGIEPISLRHTAAPADEEERLAALCQRAGMGTDAALMAAMLKNLRPSAVFSALDTPNIATGIGGIFAGTPHVVLSFRNYNPSRFSYMNFDWYRPMYQAVCAAKNVLLSGNAPDANADYARWLGIANDRIGFVPNAISAEFFKQPSEDEVDQLRRQLLLTRGQPVVLGVFRLSEEKQPLLFLDVCERILRSQPDVRIFHAGTGHQQAAIDRAVRKRSLQGRITFLGARTDVPALMRIASVLLLTSALEGMPNVVMEAQFSGLPVVATKAGATMACLVDGVTGLVLERTDARGLANACLRILGNPALARHMGNAGAQRARSEFTPDRMVDRFIAILNRGSDGTELRQRVA